MWRLAFTALLLAAASARAQDAGDVFNDGPDGAKVHATSGFVCPAKLAGFERDAVGQKDPESGSDFCAYSALDGVYGTIVLMPLPKTYDPKAILTPDFVVEEGTGGRMLGEAVGFAGSKGAQVPVYQRSYETARLESLHYRTLYASAAVGAWAVDVTIEYAEPRDVEIERDFLNAVYAAALSKIAH